jgi:hypothetical protein
MLVVDYLTSLDTATQVWFREETNFITPQDLTVVDLDNDGTQEFISVMNAQFPHSSPRIAIDRKNSITGQYEITQAIFEPDVGNPCSGNYSNHAIVDVDIDNDNRKELIFGTSDGMYITK